jgi:hypothetical protein
MDSLSVEPTATRCWFGLRGAAAAPYAGCSVNASRSDLSSGSGAIAETIAGDGRLNVAVAGASSSVCLQGAALDVDAIGLLRCLDAGEVQRAAAADVGLPRLITWSSPRVCAPIVESPPKYPRCGSP